MSSLKRCSLYFPLFCMELFYLPCKELNFIRIEFHKKVEKLIEHLAKLLTSFSNFSQKLEKKLDLENETHPRKPYMKNNNSTWKAGPITQCDKLPFTPSHCACERDEKRSKDNVGLVKKRRDEIPNSGLSCLQSQLAAEPQTDVAKRRWEIQLPSYISNGRHA